MTINPTTFKKHLKYVLSIVLNENKSLAKQYVQQNKLSQEDFAKLLEIDPSTTKKYVGWMAKQWIVNKQAPTFDIDSLRNTIREYHVYVTRGKAKTNDINRFNTFADLHKEVDELNNSGDGVSDKDLENDYEIVLDNASFFIAVPHTHEASRKLGLSKFAFRDCSDGSGGKDSSWCTTYKAPNHFNDYYYKYNITFYYILVRDEKILNALIEAFPERNMAMKVVAIALADNDKSEAYDGKDSMLSDEELEKYKSIIGIR
jgi:predicted transcriptional regulator